MFKRLTLLAMCLLLSVATVFAQDVPDEIDDYDGDWEDVIDELDDSGYIAEKNGELVLEERRVRFDDDEDIFIQFDLDDTTNFVMASVLQMEPLGDDDDDDFEYCMLTFRDDFDDGFLGVAIDEFASVALYDRVFESDDSAFIDSEDHDEDVDDEVHVIVVALDDEVTVYINGELALEEDDLSVREATLGLLRSDETPCEAEDLWIFALDDSERTTSTSRGSDDDDSSSRSSSSDLPDEIDDYDGTSESVIAQLVEEGVLGSGNSFLFGEDYSFIGFAGSSFFPLGRGRTRTDVVMGVEITFDAQSSSYEQCGVLLRVDENRDPAEDFLFIGIDSDDDLFIRNNSADEEDTFNFFSVDADVDDPHHLIIIARGETVAIYLNGELVVSDYPIYEERGIFGVAQFSESTSSTCEARNMWVYDTPFFEDGVCNVIASGNVNRRSGPSTSTDVAGQLVSGETSEVVAQTEPGDGYVWYELEDGSYVREDIISLVGDCSDVPED